MHYFIKKIRDLLKKIIFVIIIILINPKRIKFFFEEFTGNKRKPKEIKEYKKLKDYTEKNNNSFDVLSLKPCSELNQKKTGFVVQTEAVILNNPEKEQALYTHKITSCTILILKENKTKKIGLAHFDELTEQKYIKQFIGCFSDFEAFILSASNERFFLALLEETLKKTQKIKMKFKTRKQSKGIAITGKGIIYYGDNSKIEAKELKQNRLLELKVWLKSRARLFTIKQYS